MNHEIIATHNYVIFVIYWLKFNCVFIYLGFQGGDPTDDVENSQNLIRHTECWGVKPTEERSLSHVTGEVLH